MPHGLQISNFLSVCRYLWLHLDLQRVTINRFRLFRHGEGANSKYSPPVDSFEYARPSSRNRLLGTEISSRSKSETTLTRGRADKTHGAVYCCDDRKQQTIHTKKERTDCSNYRWVLLVSHAGKGLLKIVTSRLSNNCETEELPPEEQCGLRPARSTT